MSVYIKDNPGFLKLALDSMIVQTIPPDEIVLVEDGPLTEELYFLINAFNNSHLGLFTILKNENNLGLGMSLNKGLLACKNELVARMDSDDIAVPDRCRQQLDFLLSHPETAIVGGDISEFIDMPLNVIGYRKVPCNNEEIKKYAKKRCPLNHMTVMFRKSAVLSVGNYMDWHYNEDYYLWLRMLINGDKFANTGTVLVNVRVGEEMYKRRGGLKYFISEAKLQKYMLHHKMIGIGRYIINIGERLILQVLMPNYLRGWVFRRFARVGYED